MEHREYIRIVPDANTAVLFMHGICGTPNHFRDLIPLVDLVPENWSVCNVLLDGHGGSIDDFARTSMCKWKQQVFSVFDMLCESHQRVIIVGHSMGTLFAMQMAMKRADKVPFLFLIAVPMRPWTRLFGIKNLLKLAFGRLREDVPLEAATRRVAGINATPQLWKYPKWIPRFLELFREICLTEKGMGNLAVPCVAWQSRKDELVSNFSANVLQRCGKFEIHELSESTHFYYAPEDQAVVRAAFTRMIQQDGVTHCAGFAKYPAQ